MLQLLEVMRLLANQAVLEASFKDHALKGNWKGYRECHLSPDWLLIYKVEGDILTFVRTGTHSELFG